MFPADRSSSPFPDSEGLKIVATVSENAQHGYADADEFIQYQLEQARSRIKATDLLTATVLSGLLLVGYVLTFTLLDHWVIDGGFSAGTRAAMLIAILTLCGGILFRYVLRPWFRTIHPLYAARMLDRSSQGLEGSLLALVDLQSGGRKNDSAIQRTLEKRAAVKLAEIGVLTPPVGLNVFVVKSSSPIPVTLGQAFAGVTPFIVLDFLSLGLYVAFPEMITWLPNLTSP